MVHLFLDLEETLIIDWFNPILKTENIKIIKKFIKENKIKKATMFSAAIWKHKEKEEFDKKFKLLLEEVLEIKLEVLVLEEAFSIVIKKNNICAVNNAFLSSEIFLFNQKEDFFKQWLLATKQKGTFVLFDDTVEDSVFMNKNIQIVMKGVK